MNKKETAVKHFRSGFNCAQSVLKTCAEELGLDENLAVKLASEFGGGLARSGHVCGAVSGAVMVIGLRYGILDRNDTGGKLKAREITGRFLSSFREKRGTLLCRELLGHDIITETGYRKISDKDLFVEMCPGFVSDAVKILEELLQ